MIDLPEPRELAPARAEAVRRQLMATMLAEPARPDGLPARRRTRPLVVVLVCLLVVGGFAVAIAITASAAEHSTSDSVVVDRDLLDVLYRGHRITQDDLAVLTQAGQGTFTAADVDTEHDLHATRAFDTLDELDAYSSAYLAWQEATADGEDVGTWGSVQP